VEHAPQLSRPFPWRAATLVVGAIAAGELVVLIAIGAVHIVPSHKAGTVAAPAAKKASHVRPAIKVPPPPTHPIKSRRQTHVLVLNGNGRNGAASSQAVQLQTLGYTVNGAENAPRHDYARSMIMYVRGFLPEARRLSHDIGVRLVAPVDGLSPNRLQGSKVVVLLGR